MLESRCLRSRRAFLDHHRPCSSITRRRRRRGGVRCRRRDAQWPCRPRLFEQYASTRRGDTDLHPRVLEWISIAIETFNPLCTWLWLRDSIILVYRFYLSVHERLWTSLHGIRRKTMWPTGRLVSSHSSQGDWEGKRGYNNRGSSRWSMKRTS